MSKEIKQAKLGEHIFKSASRDRVCRQAIKWRMMVKKKVVVSIIFESLGKENNSVKN